MWFLEPEGFGFWEQNQFVRACSFPKLGLLLYLS
jgi:hypothetical protein